MAASPSPNQPAYFSPSIGRNHSRRSSTRRSFSSSLIESPRTLCPRDGDAFSYNPAHLADWYIPQDLWDRLAPKLQTTLAAMQHGGAAVLTGFERLEKHIKHLESGHPIHKLREEELMGQLALPPPKLRTTSDASSASFSDTSSSVFTDTPNSGCTSPSVSGSQDASPVSPMCLSPFDSQCLEKRERTRERSFSTPREAHDAYFTAELSHLRTEALTRLRHTARKVDQEWSEAKRTNALFPGDIKDFEDWWGKKKSTITYLNEKGKRMSLAIGLSSSGMGWTYAP